MSDHIRFVGPFDRVLFLKSQPYNAGLSTGELSVLARAARERRFTRGQTLIKSGYSISHWYLIVEGEVLVEESGTLVHTVKAADVVGFLRWLAEARGETTFVAKTDLVTLEFPTDATLEIYEDHFGILQTTIQNVSAQIHNLLLSRIPGTHRQIWPEAVALPDRRLDLVERILLFRRSPFFREISLETLAHLVSNMEEIRLPAGTTLWEDGDPGGSVALVLAGIVHGSLADGKSFTAGPGYPLGSVESIARRPRWYTATAQSDVAILRANTELFVDMFEDQFDIGLNFLREQARGLLRYLGMQAAKS